MASSSETPNILALKVAENLTQKQIVPATLMYDLFFKQAISVDVENAGGRVRIRKYSTAAAVDYLEPSTVLTYSNLLTTSQDVVLSKTAAVPSFIHDIDAVINNPFELANISVSHGDAIGQTIDKYAAGLYTGFGIADIAVSLAAATDAYDAIFSEASMRLNLANCPDDGGRFMIIDARTKRALMKSGRIINVQGDKQAAILRYGISPEGQAARNYVGQFDGFDVFWSNNLANTGTVPAPIYKCIYGHVQAIATIGIGVKINTQFSSQGKIGSEYTTWKHYGGKVLEPAWLGTVTSSA